MAQLQLAVPQVVQVLADPLHVLVVASHLHQVDGRVPVELSRSLPVRAPVGEAHRDAHLVRVEVEDGRVPPQCPLLLDGDLVELVVPHVAAEKEEVTDHGEGGQEGEDAPRSRLVVLVALVREGDGDVEEVDSAKKIGQRFALG